MISRQPWLNSHVLIGICTGAGLRNIPILDNPAYRPSRPLSEMVERSMDKATVLHPSASCRLRWVIVVSRRRPTPKEIFSQARLPADGDGAS